MGMREEFEAWQSKETPGSDLQRIGENAESYRNMYVAERWIGWNACCKESNAFSKEELNLFRQWFNAMEDLTPSYIEKSDCDLYSKVMGLLK